jgi:hypothetical protein
LGTARLTAAHFRRASVRVGLSWRNLADALGHAADPARWAVLYLGSTKPAGLPPGQPIAALNRKGMPFPDQEARLAKLAGIILLDGSWSQAKALWWRNPWLLKLTRLVLAPQRPSRYGKLRREARREALSTLEAAALTLSHLEGNPEVSSALLASFDALLDRYRAAKERMS